MTERRRFLRHTGRCRKWNGLWKITNWRIIIDFKDSPRVLLKSEPKYGARIRLVVERSSHVTFSFVTLDYRLHGGRISWVILWIINLKLRDSARRNFFDWLALCENERKKTPAMLMRKHDARARLNIIQISADHADDELLITPLNGSRAPAEKSSSFTFVQSIFGQMSTQSANQSAKPLSHQSGGFGAKKSFHRFLIKIFSTSRKKPHFN